MGRANAMPPAVSAGALARAGSDPVGRVQDPVGGRGRGAGDARVGDELLDRRLIGEEGPEGVLAGPLVDDHELAVRVLGEDMADGAGRYSSLAELEHRLLVPAGDHLLQRRRGGIELRDDYDAHFVLQSGTTLGSTTRRNTTPFRFPLPTTPQSPGQSPVRGVSSPRGGRTYADRAGVTVQGPLRSPVSGRTAAPCRPARRRRVAAGPRPE